MIYANSLRKRPEGRIPKEVYPVLIPDLSRLWVSCLTSQGLRVLMHTSEIITVTTYQDLARIKGVNNCKALLLGPET